jgi:phosphoenolpyruvate phosphomutase
MTKTQTVPCRSKLLRGAPQSTGVLVSMEARNGLSAKLAQEAGFEALRGRGVAISTAPGVGDINEASWTQVLEILEFIADESGNAGGQVADRGP